MTALNDQQKQLVFDYCMGLTSEKETADAKSLISSNQEAAHIHSAFTAALSPLDSLESQSCPDSLVESTIWRLNNAARSSQLQLEQLLAAEQTRSVTTKKRFWPNFGQLIATAAVILLFASVLFPTLANLRQNAWQQQCQMQLGRMGQAIGNYASDHNGKLPAVATTAGAPWWKVGKKGDENHSNTRHMWLLVKGDYIKPDDFVCPGKRQGQAIQLDAEEAKNYNDFPARRYVTYSFRIMCDDSKKKNMAGQKVLMADLNPLFEKLPQSYAKPFKLKLDKKLLTLNSINHNRRGQNLLLYDGGVQFVKNRQIGILEDDIYTLQDTDIYKGVEVPTCETDDFLAP